MAALAADPANASVPASSFLMAHIEEHRGAHPSLIRMASVGTHRVACYIYDVSGFYQFGTRDCLLLGGYVKLNVYATGETPPPNCEIVVSWKVVDESVTQSPITANNHRDDAFNKLIVELI